METWEVANINKLLNDAILVLALLDLDHDDPGLIFSEGDERETEINNIDSGFVAEALITLNTVFTIAEQDNTLHSVAWQKQLFDALLRRYDITITGADNDYQVTIGFLDRLRKQPGGDAAESGKANSVTVTPESLTDIAEVVGVYTAKQTGVTGGNADRQLGGCRS